MPGVLIVDADPNFSAAAQSVLEEHGHTVAVREDAALETLRSVRPAVLLLSMELPKGGSGFSICSRLRRDKELKGTKILLTGSASDANAFTRHATTPDRADDYLTKPIDAAGLVARVDKLAKLAETEPPIEASAPPGSTGRQGPPPLRGAPPPLPGGGSESRGQDSRAGEARSPETTIPPRATRGSELADPTSSGEAFRPQTFDEMVRERSGVAPPTAPTKSTPEEKTKFLRDQVKYYETERKAIKEAWDGLQNAGRDFERRLTVLRGDLVRRDQTIAETRAEIERLKGELGASEKKYETFEAEIDKIFREKQSEEESRTAELVALTGERDVLLADVAALEKRVEEDNRRLVIFQEELESLESENADFTEKNRELEVELSAAHDELSVTKARLETTETVATERAEELEALRDQIDKAALEAAAERARLEEVHDALRRELEAEQEATMAAAIADWRIVEDELRARLTSLEAEGEAELSRFQAEREAARVAQESEREDLRVAHEFALAEAEERRQDEVEGLLASHAAQLESLRRDHAIAHEAVEARRYEEVVALETRIEELEAAHRAELEQTQAAVEQEREDAEAHRQAELEDLASAHASDVAAIGDAHRAEADELRDTIAELEARLAAEETARDEDRAALEAQLLEAEDLRAGQLAEAEERRVRELEATRQRAADDLANAAFEHQRELEVAAEAHAVEVATLTQQLADSEDLRKTELEKAEKKRRSELDKLEKRRKADLDAAAEEKLALDTQRARELDAAARKLEDAERRHQKALDEVRTLVEDAEERHRSDLEAADQRLFDTEAHWKAQLEEAAAKRNNDLDELAKSNAAALANYKASAEQAIARIRGEHKRELDERSKVHADEKKALDKELDRRTVERNELSAKLQSLVEDHGQLEAQLGEQERWIGELTEKLGAKENELNAALEELSKSKRARAEEQKKAKSELSASKNETAAAKNEAAVAKNETATAKTELQKLRGEHAKLADRLAEETRAALDGRAELESQLQRLEEELEASRNAATTTLDALETKRREAEALSKARAELEARVADLELLLTTTRDQLERQSERESQQLEEKSTLEQQLGKRETELAKLDQELARSRRELEDERTRSAEDARRANELSTSLEESLASNRDLDQQKEAAKRSVAELKKQLQVLRDAKVQADKDAETASSRAKDALAAEKKAREALASELDETKAQLARREADLNGARRQVDDLASRLDDESGNRERAVADQQRHLAAQNDRIGELESRVREKDRELLALKKQLQRADTELAELQKSRTADSDAKVAELSAKNRELETIAKSRDDALARAAEEATEREFELNDAQRLLAEYKSRAESLGRELSELTDKKRTRDSIEQRLAELLRADTELRAQLAEKNERIRALEVRIEHAISDRDYALQRERLFQRIATHARGTLADLSEQELSALESAVSGALPTQEAHAAWPKGTGPKPTGPAKPDSNKPAPFAPPPPNSLSDWIGDETSAGPIPDVVQRPRPAVAAPPAWSEGPSTRISKPPDDFGDGMTATRQAPMEPPKPASPVRAPTAVRRARPSASPPPLRPGAPPRRPSLSPASLRSDPSPRRPLPGAPSARAKEKKPAEGTHVGPPPEFDVVAMPEELAVAPATTASPVPQLADEPSPFRAATRSSDHELVIDDADIEGVAEDDEDGTYEGALDGPFGALVAESTAAGKDPARKKRPESPFDNPLSSPLGISGTPEGKDDGLVTEVIHLDTLTKR
ncbi:MAG: response regulator [Deltaproteobacteria bacterium]|nr:response regulator [Deltaproteobacteria bacterium]